MIKVGILALQGDFEAHQKAIHKAHAETILVKNATDLEKADGLIIPGGESTTILKLLNYETLVEPLKEFAKYKPVFGTCAGAILIANKVFNPEQFSFGLIDMEIERNAYGRQLDSSIQMIDTDSTLNAKKLEAVFIRAPKILKVGKKVKILAALQNDPVLVEQDKHMAGTFHPELTDSNAIHEYFLKKIENQ